MSKIRLAIGAVLVCASLLVSSVDAIAAEGAFVPGQVLIKFKPTATATEREAVRSDLGATESKALALIGAEVWRITNYAVENAVDRYAGSAEVQYIEPNYIVTALEIPNDPMFNQLWGLNNTGQTGGTPGADIDAVRAWDVFKGSDQVLVGVIDTGVDYTHPDLAANIWTNPGEGPVANGVDDDGNGFIDDIHGWDFVNGDNNPMDDHGHGSHCSGTIGAVGDNGVGVTGVNWTVRIAAIKFLDAGGSGSNADAVLAIQYATTIGVKIMSNSWGGGSYSQAMYDAIQAAYSAGILFMAAAGNDGADNDVYPHYPSSYDLPNVVAVAATDNNDNLAYFSCYGLTSVDLGAPGVDILSTAPGSNYATMSGTSMATPHVSGVAALIWGRFPGITADGVKTLLLNSTDHLVSLEGKCVSEGRLNAFNALAEPDSIAPSAVTDLAAGNPGSNLMGLTWTATGDDSLEGTASYCDVRYSTSPIDEANFQSATAAPDPPDPGPSGTGESMTVRRLDFETDYYFALRVLDEYGNASAISNVATGATLGIPDIEVSPMELQDSLFTGETSSQDFTVSNVAEGTLDFEIRISMVIPLAVGKQQQGSTLAGPTLTRRFFDLPGRTAVVVEGADKGATPPRQVKADPIRVWGSDLTDVVVLYDNYHGERTSFAVTILVGDLVSRGATLRENVMPLTSEALADVDILWLDEWAYITFSTDELQAIDGWLRGGGAIFQHGDEPGSVADLLAPYGIAFGGYGNGGTTTNIIEHPVTDSVAAVYVNSPMLNLIMGGDGETVVFDIGGLGHVGVISVDRGRIFSVSDEDFHDAMIGSASNRVLGNNAIDWLAGAVSLDWLSVDPVAGTVTSGSPASIRAVFDAAGLEGGSYDADIVIVSNDPDEPETNVRAHLDVTGAPDIEVSDSILDYGPVYIGASSIKQLTVKNTGTDSLVVSGIDLDHSDYSVDATSFTLGPQKKRVLGVTFSPTNEGIQTGSLTIHSNATADSVVVVGLLGVGVVPPEIGVTPEYLVDSLYTGETSTQIVTISNTGGSDLVWKVKVEKSEALRSLAREAVRGITMTGSVTVDGKAIKSFTDDELAAFRQRLSEYYLGVKDLSRDAAGLQSMAVVGSDSYDMIYYLLADSVLTSRYEFVDVGGYDDYSAISGYDGVVVCEYDADISPTEAATLSEYYRAGKPILLGMDDLDDNFAYYPQTGPLLRPVFGISDPFDGDYYWGSLNPANPITDGISMVYEFCCDNDWYALDGADWIFAGTDGNAYGISYDGTGRTVLMGENLSYVWGAGNGHLIGNAIDWMMEGVGWLSVVPDAGTVGVGGSADVEARFDATGMYGGDYAADVVVASNDVDDPEVRVPVSLHVTGAPDITVSDSVLAYGQVFISVSVPETLVVTNDGTDTLVVSDVSTDNGDYTADVASFVLLPEEEQAVVVTFSPSAPGASLGTLTVTSNDIDEPTVSVVLEGEGLIPPEIGVSPDSLSDSLYTGETSTQILTISNSGGSDLVFDISAVPTPASAFSMPGIDLPIGAGGPVREAEDNNNLGYITDSTPARLPQGAFGDLAGTVGILVWNKYSDNSSGGEFENTINAIATYFSDFTLEATGVTDPDSLRAMLVGRDVFLIPEQENAPSDITTIGASWQDVLQDFVSGGGTVVFCGEWGSSNSFVTSTGLMDVSLFGGGSSALEVVDPSHPLVKDVAQTFYGENATGWYTIATPDVEAVVVEQYGGLPVVAARTCGAGHVVLIGFDYYSYNADMAHIVANAVQLSSGLTWLHVDPSSGTVPIGGSTEVTVTFDATGMYGGDYAADIVVTNNDPSDPEVRVPVSLHVTGAPDITVSDSVLAYGEVFIGVSVPETLVVTNDGTDTLVVSDVSADNGDYTVDVASFVLLPEEEQAVVVTFSPSAPGDRSATLTITSNDPDEPAVSVALEGEGLIPPEVHVAPSSLADSLLTGETSTQIMTISNTGGSDLVWKVKVEGSEALRGLAREAVRGITMTGSVTADGKAIKSFTDDELAAFKQRLSGYYLGVEGLSRGVAGLQSVAVVGPYTWNMLYELLADSVLAGRYEFVGVYGYDDYSAVAGYDGLVVCEYNADISPTEAATLSEFYQAGKPILLGMDDLDDDFSYYPGNGPLLKPVFGISNVFDGYYYWGSLNPANPITDGISMVYEFCCGNDWYARDGADWIFAGTDGNAYGISYDGTARTVLMGENLLYIWWDGNQHLIANAIDWMMEGVGWLSVVPDTGTVGAGGSADVEARFDATGMYGGDYTADIVVMNNDPSDPEVRVPVSLHVTGVPDINVWPVSLDYGDVPVGITMNLPVRITNGGAEQLDVTGFGFDNPEFSTQAIPFSLGAGEITLIDLAFTPAHGGPRSGTLTISSNDPDEPEVYVALAGVGAAAAGIEVSPDTVSTIARMGRPRSTHLGIENTGGADLIYEVHLGNPAAPLLAGALGTPPATLGSGGPDAFGHFWIDSDNPGGPVFDWIEISGVGTPIPISGDDVNQGPYPIGFDFPFYMGSFSTFRICTNGFVTLTGSASPGSNLSLPSAVAPENLLAVFWDDLVFAPGSAFYHFDGAKTVIECKDVSRAAGNGTFTFEIILYPDGGIVYQYLSVEGDGGSATVGIQDDSGIDALQMAFNTSYLHDSLAVEIACMPVWLSVTPQTGVIPPGGYEDLTARFDALGLYPGVYHSKIRICSNDPGRPVVCVPANFTVVRYRRARYLETALNVVPGSSDDRWIYCDVGLSAEFDPDLVDVGTVFLSVGDEAVNADPGYFRFGLPDETGTCRLCFRFDRASVERILPEGNSVVVEVTGGIEGSEYFSGSEAVTVVKPRLIHPAGGESFEIGGNIIASWAISDSLEFDSCALYFSPDCGVTWQEVATGLAGQNATVAVPDDETTMGLFRVCVVRGGKVVGYDTSDAPFTINMGVMDPKADVPDSFVPTAFALGQNRPNPFGGSTTLLFDLPREAKVDLNVYDVSGGLVRNLVDQVLPAGRYSLGWDGRDAAGRQVVSGVYFYKIEAGNFSETRRMVVVR
ncbi:MAG: choice-of-anchor D domain-containing protein [Candidatus Eisenbacteria bacterium]